MKKIILLASLVVFAACSSKPKEEAPAEAATQTEATTQVDAAAEKSVTAMDASMESSGEFPDVEGTERSGATCKNGATERMVSVIDTREGPCGVVYTKGNRKKTVAYAKHDMSFCDKVYDNIVGNLSNGGFDCGGAQATAPQAEPEAEEATSAE